MPTPPIIYFGDERLTTPSKEVKDFGPQTQQLINDMFETMYTTNGIGLAAPQLGINLQLTVIDITEDKSKQWCLINPKFIDKQGECSMQEGCLSIPGVFETIKRPAQVEITALNRNGELFQLKADGLLARCIQHEYDHLHGKLFIDYLSSFKRQYAIEKYLKTLRQLKKDH